MLAKRNIYSVVITAFILLIVIFLVKLIWFKPVFVSHFFYREMISSLLKEPQTVSIAKLPILKNWSKDKLNDWSAEARIKRQKSIVKNLDIILGYNEKWLSEKNRISKELLQWHLEMETKCSDFEYYRYLINPYNGSHLSIPNFLDVYHSIEKKSDIKLYNKRLKELSTIMYDVITHAETARLQGIIPSQALLERSGVQIANFIAVEPAKNFLYASLLHKIEQNGGIPRSEKLLRETLQIIQEEVYPAYSRLLDYTRYLISKDPEEAGVWSLPNGQVYYQHLLEKHTSLSISPDSMYALGIEELVRIKKELILGFEKIDVKTTQRNVITELKTIAENPENLLGYSIEGRLKYMEAYDSLLNLADTQVNDLFFHKPITNLQVKRVPGFKEKNASIASYETSSLDEDSTASMYIRMDVLDHLPIHYLPTIVYHVGLPGHHYQIAGQMENKDIPVYRKRFFTNAYIEGWAAYAEYLMYENGAYDNNPKGNIGRLRFELLNCARLIADLGIHYKKWSRQEAEVFLSVNTDLTNAEIQSEIDRSFSNPAQASSRHIGMLKIMDLREKYRSHAGKAYDIREFHNMLLNHGNLPFFLLEGIIPGCEPTQQ